MQNSLSNILIKAQNLLKSKGFDNYQLDSEILLCEILKIGKLDLILNNKRILTKSEIENFEKLIEKRLDGLSIAKIIGKKEFYSLEFEVNKHVLDPRPDSETLIDAAQKFYQKQDKFKILEIGSGSGCLVVTLLKLFQNAEALALDISSQALKLTEKNAKTHKVNSRLKTKKLDFLKESLKGKFDLIISNPPYIVSRETIDLIQKNQVSDPKLALDGGKDGLTFYKQIAVTSKPLLNKDAKIVLEIGHNQKESVTKIFQTQNFHLQKSYKDLGQNPRCLIFS